MKKRRIQLLAGLLAIFAVAMVVMNWRYDPLARNTSVNASNRGQLLHYLDEQEILYLVENNIDVNIFYEFIEEPLFQLEHYRLYRAAMDVKYGSTKEVVTFINAVAGKIETDQLMAALPNYEYGVLRKLIVDLNPYSFEATIIANPYDLTTYVSMNHTIGEFAPRDLVNLSDLAGLREMGGNHRLRKEAAEALNDICLFLEEGYDLSCGGFVVDQAYLSYHEIQDGYLKQVQSAGAQSAFDEWGMPSHNEHQLGLAVDLKLLDHSQGDNHYFDTHEMVNNDVFHSLAVQASSFGFLFYPNDGVLYAHNSQPFHLRYVGLDEARTCVEDGVCFYHRGVDED